MGEFRESGNALEWRGRQELVRIEAWGEDSVRVRAGLSNVTGDVPGALLDCSEADPNIKIGEHGAQLINGRLLVRVSLDGLLEFLRADTEEELLAEEAAHFWWPGPRRFAATGNGYYRLEQNFRSYAGEKLFGLGQHLHGLFDQKGSVVDLVQRNAEVSVPFLFSSRGYAMLWNMPAVGRVELAANGTRWVADSARQIDYWVTTGASPQEVLRHYGEATGFPPVLPEWASGFWQSKLRYRSQEELLEVAREYRRRGLPLSVIVSDFFHWSQLGDWRFDPDEWPDPEGAVAELDDLEVRLMVSIWPSVSPLSDNYDEMLERGLLIGTEHGVPMHADWPDKGVSSNVGVAFYDATNPEARRFVWERARDNYYRYGIRVWWLDACEPEIKPGHVENLRFHQGPGLEVANMYPLEHARGFYEGMRGEGETDVVTLCRSAWAGSQRYGAALWSGDIPATFQSLRDQIGAGLNVALSGIPWWTTDIGGFHGGDPDSAYFRELVVRWFQYAVFCPLFRLHGNRDPRMALDPLMTGGPNEVWSFGADAYEGIRACLLLRERLRPYVMEQMRTAHELGTPPMRPVFFDFPDDAYAWEMTSAADTFLFGPDLLVAPVTEYGARGREVYLPAGATWKDSRTGGTHQGGESVRVEAPLDQVPVFLRNGRALPLHDAST